MPIVEGAKCQCPEQDQATGHSVAGVDVCPKCGKVRQWKKFEEG